MPPVVTLPPLEVLSIHFQYPDSAAIPLRDPLSDTLLGGEPEWIRDRRNVPVAYVRGSQPSIRVTFLVHYDSPDPIEISALGNHGVELQPVSVKQLGGSSGATFSRTLELQFARPLPDRIGLHTLQLRWFATWKDTSGIPLQVLIGSTFHTVCTTWRHLVVQEEERLRNWIYTPLALWTSEWCAGLDDEKDICDAIIQNLPRSGLCYGIPGWNVRYMLLAGGGMCGGWYVLFQQMAACQGVFVEKRTFYIHWPVTSTAGKSIPIEWNALVCDKGGLNNPGPNPRSSVSGPFNQALVWYPPRSSADITQIKTRMYVFMGQRGKYGDGHCINFLRHGGRLYVYDASFQKGGIEVDMELPPKKPSLVPGCNLLSFKQNYLDRTLKLLGSMRVQAVWFEPNPSTYLGGIVVGTNLVREVDLYWSA